MKLLIGLVLVSLCFCSLALDISTLKTMASMNKRDSAFTAECQAGVLAMLLNREYVQQESQRECFEPEPVAKSDHEYIVRCSSSTEWLAACTAAGGEVCHVTASAVGPYSGDSDGKATIKMEAGMCVPLSCKKGGNLEEFSRAKVAECVGTELSQCKMKITCGKASAKAVVIIGAILGALLVAGLLGVLGFFLYRRYFALNASGQASSSSVAIPFAEYSELAQYEDEADLITGEIPEDEEVHAIN